MIGLFLACGLAALVASYIATPFVIRQAHARGLMSETGGRRIHSGSVPRLGGIAVFSATVIGLGVGALMIAVFPDIEPMGPTSRRFFLGLVLGASMLFLIGMLDDVVELRPRWKLAPQVLAAVIAFAFGIRITVLSPAFGWELALGWMSLPLTVFWIVGVTNAYNLIDGLDGLASGIALVALVATAAAAALLGRVEVLLVTSALIGALIGFLPYNFNPARIFLGDSGSLFIGFMLAVLSVHGSMKSTTAVLAAVPLLALAIPIIDMLLSVMRRWLRGTPISSPDARHIHHRLLALGLTHRRAVVVLYAVATVLATLGLLLAFSPPRHLAIAAGIGGLATLGMLIIGLKGLNYDEFVVASLVIASAPNRVRRVIRDKIQAREVARMLEAATSPAEIDAALETSAEGFGFLHIEVCPETANGRDRFAVAAPGRRIWKLDYPLPEWDSGPDLSVLRIWCSRGDGLRPHGAERVAHILAPALEEWLRKRQLDPRSHAAPIGWVTDRRPAVVEGARSNRPASKPPAA